MTDEPKRTDIALVQSADDLPARLDRLRLELEAAATVEEVLPIRNRALAATKLAKQSGLAREGRNEWSELKMRTDRKLGELLKQFVHPGNPQLFRDGTNGQIPAGVTRKESFRTQMIADVPLHKFDDHIATTKTRDELTDIGLLRLAKAHRREQHRADNRELVAMALPLEAAVSATFPTIVVDPPWDWGDEGDVDQFGRGRPVYATMTFDELLALPVGAKATADAHIYLWITNRSLPKGFALLDAWGFRYVTCLTWCKPSIGMGNYFRGSTEQVLFGVRGSLGLLRADIGTWFAADRPGRHSAKPDEFYDLVESASPGPWLDIFARRARPGWAVWGAEVG